MVTCSCPEFLAGLIRHHYVMYSGAFGLRVHDEKFHECIQRRNKPTITCTRQDTLQNGRSLAHQSQSGPSRRTAVAAHLRNPSKLSAADPPGASHAAAIAFAIAAAFLLISSPAAVSPITVRTASATASSLTTELSTLPLATSTQTPHSTTSFALKNCSAPSGHPTSGTPWERPSEDGVPPAVGQERARRRVRQDPHLRRPPAHQEPRVRPHRALLEARREPLRPERALRVEPHRRAERPEEAAAARL